MEYVKSIEGGNIIHAEAIRCAALLARHGVDTSAWGSGDSKTLSQLAIELLNNECKLAELQLDGEKKPVRTFSVVEANVFFVTNNGTSFRLFEEVQAFRDGRSRTRPYITASIAEKMQIHEDPDTAILRAAREELGIEADRTQLDLIDLYGKKSSSQSYPGLTNLMQVYQFDVFLSEKQYDPDGYIEEQPDKTTYFSWKRWDGQMTTGH